MGLINALSDFIEIFSMAKACGPFRPINSLNASENVYFTLYNTDTGKVWNDDSGTWVATDDASVVTSNYDNIAITCTDARAQAEDGWMPIMPTALASTNEPFQADIKFYSNATPAVSDSILLGRHCFIKSYLIGGSLQARIWSMDDL